MSVAGVMSVQKINTEEGIKITVIESLLKWLNPNEDEQGKNTWSQLCCVNRTLRRCAAAFRFCCPLGTTRVLSFVTTEHLAMEEKRKKKRNGRERDNEKLPRAEG